ATLALYQLTDYLYRYYGKKVIILLDEYDTPMQEAYVDGFWDEMVGFTRSMFNAAFKTNPWLERGIMTGITRVSKESIFSDLNNLEVVTTTSDKYATAFGFTEEEVFAALDECGLSSEKEQVKYWYDGFTFGKHEDIYNPWSILNFLDKGAFRTYWANTSSNSLVGKLLREGNRRIKEKFEQLLKGESVYYPIDEQIVYNQLNGNERAVWSLLLASGYLKVISYEKYNEIPENRYPQYELALTNMEVKLMFQNMVRDWFSDAETDYNDFIKALLAGNIKEMNAYMNRVALQTFSYFDTGKSPSGAEPERFYHGFVLGLMVELQDRYVITSNRESGFGRYDVMLEPRHPEKNDAIIMEFKVYDPEDEKTLRDTVCEALSQIEQKKYAAMLIERGISEEHIRSYGFAFQGKTVLIG
ncbi:MAG: AAA family ATPase, partial [Oliverpabstia sp.]|nr:AAA family ATPase [Oliverpabstia sp.]